MNLRVWAQALLFAIKPLEWTEKLCEAMAGNTALVSLDLSDCALDDKCCDLLGAVLEADQKLEKLILNKNAIRDGGCAKLATSLARNITLREIELFGQTGGRKWGEGCLVTWLEMYKTNFSLIRVNWTTNSKNTVTLTKMLAVSPTAPHFRPRKIAWKRSRAKRWTAAEHGCQQQDQERRQRLARLAAGGAARQPAHHHLLPAG